MLRIDISDWIIVKDDLLTINLEGENYLTEDLFQITRNNFTIDTGWYDEVGQFITFLVIDNNWDEPSIKINSNNYNLCLEALKLCIKYSFLIEND